MYTYKIYNNIAEDGLAVLESNQLSKNEADEKLRAFERRVKSNNLANRCSFAIKIMYNTMYLKSE